jgi:CspA family cold shock protein
MWNPDRGFGFIAADSGGDVFVHASALNGLQSLSPGERVVFEVEPARDGRTRAADVRIVE